MNLCNTDCKRYFTALNYVNIAVEILIHADYAQYWRTCKHFLFALDAHISLKLNYFTPNKMCDKLRCNHKLYYVSARVICNVYV